ncbi:hypothetical protein C0995_016411 [Termitomyces sp. Mi166|nr:hypothetical protein C0995_016411 [Termitomyces sp. Mi166\
MQVAQDAQTEDQLVIAPKAVHKTASRDETSNDDFEDSESESKQKLVAMPSETALEHTDHELKNVAICTEKKSKENMAWSWLVQLHKSMSCQVPDELGAMVSPGYAECLNLCFMGGLREYFYCSPHTNTMFIEATANKAASYEYKMGKAAKQPNTIVYKHAMRNFPLNMIELEQLFKYVTNLHVPT